MSESSDGVVYVYQPLNNVEPFERILRALFIAQMPVQICPYKTLFSILKTVLAGSECLHVISDGFDSFFGICMPFESGPPRKFAKLSNIYGKYESFGKNFGGPNSMRLLLLLLSLY